MGIGKYVTNFSVIGALMSGLGTMKQSQSMPQDWRRILVWGVWLASLVLAIVGVSKQVDDERFEENQRERERQAKLDAKAARKSR